MQGQFQIRRVSKQRADELKKSGALGRSLLLDTFNGFLLIEPVGSNLGDGDFLSPEEAEYELQPVWHLGPMSALRQARKRLGLEAEIEAGQFSGSSV
ncbi:MAG TPA: hypothetical protein VE999_00310 [Gemmataceae bacterium]|nr:hypothetical protein [Gemmataceae bacterium]